MCQDKCLDWFPRLRAISLAVEDVDGEQNEWKTLQGQVNEICAKKEKPSSKNIQFLIGFMISVGSNSNTGPATLLAAGRPQGPDDRTAQTQAADG